MCQETFVKWVQDFDVNLVCFMADSGIKMFHLLQLGFLGLERMCNYGLFVW